MGEYYIDEGADLLKIENDKLIVIREYKGLYSSGKPVKKNNTF